MMRDFHITLIAAFHDFYEILAKLRFFLKMFLLKIHQNIKFQVS